MFKGKLIYRTVALFMAVVILLIAAFGVAAVFCVTRNYENSFIAHADSAIQSGLPDSLQTILNSSKREFVKQYEIKKLLDSYSSVLKLRRKQEMLYSIRRRRRSDCSVSALCRKRLQKSSRIPP